jgi:hypothetical protein
MLAAPEMSVPTADGLLPKGTLDAPPGRPGAVLPPAVPTHPNPATRAGAAPRPGDLPTAAGMP